MFARYLFTLITRLIGSRLVTDYVERNGAQEDTCTARLGPLHLAVNRCFVLDHEDAEVGARIPLPGGELRLGYVVCRGEDEIRRPGFRARRLKSLLHVR